MCEALEGLLAEALELISHQIFNEEVIRVTDPTILRRMIELDTALR